MSALLPAYFDKIFFSRIRNSELWIRGSGPVRNIYGSGTLGKSQWPSLSFTKILCEQYKVNPITDVRGTEK